MVGIKKNDLSDVSSKHNAGVRTVIVTHSDVETFPSQPETQRLSKERSESIPKFAEPACDTSDVGGQERCTVQLVEAVEADRCSAERLEEIKEISDELVMPALEEAE